MPVLYTWMRILAFSVFLFGWSISADANPNRGQVQAEVIVCGGSTAGLATALAAAEEGAEVVLLEPTDWVGGQLTSSGVPAVDEAWHVISEKNSDRIALRVKDIARDPRNMTPAFRDILSRIGNPGKGWVSRYCFEPKRLLEDHLIPWERRLAGRLTIYRNTVIKRVELTEDGKSVRSVVAIQRTAKHGKTGYERLPSVDIPDWYSSDATSRFNKTTLEFSGRNQHSVFVEATEWGEVLALAGGEYLQGLDHCDADDKFQNDRCGQDIVFGFVQELHANPMADLAPRAEPKVTDLGWGKYEGRADAWEKVWTYRRIRGATAKPATGDLSLQNWGYSVALKHGGNDYVAGYIFSSKAEAQRSIGDWQGGVDLEVMAAAEQRAVAWHHWLKSRAPDDYRDRITLAFNVLGTGHGLCKLPYIRDTRRSIGIGGFVLSIDDLVGEPGATTGKKFDDRVAIGCYPADVHPLACCAYPGKVTEHRDTRPFYIPFRAMTHYGCKNLLVPGKTMAQDFMANSATRLHPIEWSTGTAAGVIANWMVKQSADVDDVLASIEVVQQQIARRTPIEWIVNPEFVGKQIIGTLDGR